MLTCGGVEGRRGGSVGYAYCALLILGLLSCQKKIETNAADWAISPFVKLDSVNPILESGQNEFICPVLNAKVKWDEKDVFNPAAVVRNGKVYLLFRAEDTIGKYAGTSRVGLAVSDDGLHFTKMPQPVLFPAEDEMKIYEWEGGIEDPRVVESEDSTYILTESRSCKSEFNNKLLY